MCRLQKKCKGECVYTTIIALQFVEKAYRTKEKLDALMNEMESMKNVLKNIVSLTKDRPFPVPLNRILHDTFKCGSCHSVPITPSVFVTKCCKDNFMQKGMRE